MRKLVWLLAFAVFPAFAHATTNCDLASGASIGSVQAAVTAGAGATCTVAGNVPNGHTVFFQTGSFSITSQVSIPCPTSAGLLITGPTLAYPGPLPFGSPPFLATLNSSVTGTWMITLPSTGCTNPISITNLNLNGNHPSPDGGGILYFPTSGGGNITVTNDYLYGNAANYCGTDPTACPTATIPKPYDSLIWMDGGPGGNTWSNVTISWNSFGDATACNSIMSQFSYQGTAYNGAVGLCAGVGVHTNTSNFLLANNALYHMEQGFKFYEGNQTAPFYACGATNNPTCFQVLNNDFSNIHRNPIEGQMVNMTISNNSVHDSFAPGYASWGFSLPQLNCNAVTNNVEIANLTSANYWPGAQEYWGSCNSSNNLIQGYWGSPSQGAHSGAIEWGFNGNTAPYTGPATVSNNIIQVVSGQYIVDEGYGAPAPNQSGNVTSTTVAAQTSAAPSFSPGAGVRSFPLTVTLTDSGNTSGTGPQANTGIWYTTDGSTPVPGTAQRLDSGGTFVLSGPATVKAVGMWGALNQPRSYASGYGFVPSAVQSAAYTNPTTYNVNNSMSAATISSTAATAAASQNSIVQFASGTYALSSTLNLPCTNGVIYQGVAITEPNESNVPAVIFTGPSVTTYSVNVPSNGTGNTSFTQGCQFLYLGFSGQHGGIFVNYPSSGINIQYNYFTLNDGAYSGGSGTAANQNIHVGGSCPSSGSGNLCGASLGVSWLQVDSNVFYNQCATIRAHPSVDSQALCSAVWTFGYSNHEKLTNNIVDLIEEGFKWQEVYYQITNVTNTLDVENNRMSGQSRILTENQQATNGSAIFSHNSHYEPYNPGLYTFEDSLPGNGGFQIVDNVYEAGVYQVFGHYGYGVEVWGANAIGQYNLFQGANTGYSAGACGAGFFCQGWGVIMGPGNATQTWTNNYFSGIDVWNNGSNLAFEYEDGGAPPAPPAGPTISPNTIVQTSTTLTTATPVISPNGGSFAGPVTVTIFDPDSANRNVSIFYTTDGSTPAPFAIGASAGTSQVYTAPFVVSLGTTVKAIAQWGIGANQGIVFPRFGWVPSAVTQQTYSSGGTVTLSNVTVAGAGGATTVQAGSTLQLAAICHYSDGSTTPCNTLDIHGTVVTSWNTTNGNATVNSSGLATGVGIGTTNVTATVTGGVISTPAFTLTVSASPLTLSSLTLATTGGVTSIMAASNNQIVSTCHYNDGSSTTCNTVDSHGNDAGNFLSSAPTVATIDVNSGLATGVAAGSTSLTANVTPAPSMLGTNLENSTGSTNSGAMNEIYGVTGTSAGNYSPGDCHIIIPATSWAPGKHWACVLVLGTPTTQNAAALCSNTYTTVGTSWPGGDVVIPMAGVCPALPPDQGYWVGSTTDQTGFPAQGFSNCNSACNGSAPIYGSGTYPYRYISSTYGNYTNLQTSLSSSGSPGQQVSQYLLLTTTPVNSNTLPLTVTAPPPSLVSAYITPTTASLVVPNTQQLAAKCHYTSGADQDCTVTDIYGDGVTSWLTSDATKATVSSTGLVTSVAAGTPSITATIGPSGITSAASVITVTNVAVTLTGISLSTTSGVTGLFVGSTNQLKATCQYSDGSSDDCTTTDAHGTLAHSWTSTTPGHATVNSTTGLTTGVAPGSTTYTAVAGTFTATALPLTILAVPTGVYVINLSGPVSFSGTVNF